MSECMGQFPGQRLGIIGFLTERARISYQDLSLLEFDYLATEQSRAELSRILTLEDMGAERSAEEAVSVNPKTAPRKSSVQRFTVPLRATILADIGQLKVERPEVNTLAFATPGLELITADEAATLGVRLVSLVDTVVERCAALGLRQVGLFGTELDTAEDGLLATALGKLGIQTWRPEQPEMRQHLSDCVLSALGSTVIYQSRELDATRYCLEVFDRMLFESAGFMDGLVVCNPELHSLPLHLNQLRRRRESFVSAKIIDATNLYWHKLSEIASLHSKNPPDQ